MLFCTFLPWLALHGLSLCHLQAFVKVDTHAVTSLVSASARSVAQASAKLMLFLLAGSDGFMGVIKPIADDANIAMVYVTPAGIIVSVGRGFNNLFGHDIAEHIGKPLRSICKDPEEFNKLLSATVASGTSIGLARAASGTDGQDVGDLTIVHKYGDDITVRVKTMKVRL